MTKEKVAFLGTGLMGFPMALNLTRSGVPLTVWNRTQTKANPLALEGAKVASNIVDAVKEADIVISMMSDGPTVLAVIEDVLQSLKPEALWVDMSSTKPAEGRLQAAILLEQNITHLDAPVSGGTKGAEDASLAIMVGGCRDNFERARPIFEMMGRPVHVGPSGTGQLSKLCNQTIVAVTIGAVAEAMLLASEGGADPTALRSALKGGFADSTILQQHGQRMTDGNFVPGGLSKFQLKDLDNVLAEATLVNLSLPMTEDVRNRFAYFVSEMDGAEKDHSGLFLELKARNGRAS
ncbi:MAG TPA: 2-hydroxy-3-oxopropionate reductase [Rhodobacteraceae bacterium]|jgi:3-hydroxyisobutyrate dehydrogenase-like beta-hydroxyacid dehydrogenase|nr:NAD(P)-dependent oxidoreductase [Alphaproteobacteria bacterium]MDG0982705.1 NAD(P)-dependent oxidoreductase [Tateyamaria sp.]HAB39509.1 2-hydroxy-3-oxopropionate reductase [Paracoccaceae bacterium]MCH9831972.1 NAD(P)-dependent oxidoreductase [Alphaproteobacteria bacterium]MDG1421127.1 NAD(P)-dependent oxidoreductase [Tateyamaria sp.]